jgi:hypothetical protein
VLSAQDGVAEVRRTMNRTQAAALANNTIKGAIKARGGRDPLYEIPESAPSAVSGWIYWATGRE